MKMLINSIIVLIIAGCTAARTGHLDRINGSASGIDARANVIQDIAADVGRRVEEVRTEMGYVAGQAAYIRLDATTIQKQSWEAQGELDTERKWRIYEQGRAGWYFSPFQHNLAMWVGVATVAGYAINFFFMGGTGWLGVAAGFLGRLLPFGKIK